MTDTDTPRTDAMNQETLCDGLSPTSHRFVAFAETLEMELAAASTRLAELERQNKHNMDSADGWFKRNKEAEKRCEELEFQIANWNCSECGWHNQCDREELTRLRAELASAKAEVANLTRESESMCDLCPDRRESRSELERRKAEVEELRAELSEAKAEVEKAREEIYSRGGEIAKRGEYIERLERSLFELEKQNSRAVTGGSETNPKGE